MELLPLLLIFAVVYVAMIRPQQKRQREIQTMLANLAVDDDIITIGGMYGTIVDLDEEHVDVRVSANGMVLRFQKGAIAKVVPDDDLDSVDSADEDSAAEDSAADATDATAAEVTNVTSAPNATDVRDDVPEQVRDERP